MTTTRRRPTTLSGMPVDVRALASPWPSLVGRIAGLTTELEKDFRFGQSVVRMGPGCRAPGYRIGGNLKGGTSTMWYPSDRDQYRVYRTWRRREGIPFAPDPTALPDLSAFLSERSLGLESASGARGGERPPGPDWVLRFLLEVLAGLPEEHLVRPELAGFRIGGWGHDAAKGSAYDDGWVHLYDFALEGARRTLAGLLLHELGHAQERAFGPAARERLVALHQTLVGLPGETFRGVDFLLDGATRCFLQRFSFVEFAAETYMVYVSHGRRLADWIDRLAPPAAAAWREVVAVYDVAFGGRAVR